MEKGTKESGKINLATILLIIVCIIVVVCVGVFLIKQNNGKKVSKSSEKLDNPQSIDDYKAIAEEYKNFKDYVTADMGEEYVTEINTFDNIYKIIDTSNLDKYDDEYVKNFSQEEIKKAIEDYINIYNLYDINTEKLLIDFNLTTPEKIENYEELSIGDYYSYIVTDINFEDYKSKMLEYMTEEMLLNSFCGTVKSLGGKLCYIPFNSGDEVSYEITEINKDSEDNINLYNVKFLVKSVYEEDNYDTEGEIILDDENETADLLMDETENIEQAENQDLELAENQDDDSNLMTEEYEDEMAFYITSIDNKPVIGIEPLIDME